MTSPSRELARHRRMRSARRLLFVLGDQLDARMPALDELDRERDAVLMTEVREENEHVPVHRQRSTLFLAAMRHFALDLIERGFRVRYVRLDDRANTQSLGSELARAIETLGAESVRMVRPGDHRVDAMIREQADRSGVALDVLEDRSFTCTLDDFEKWASDGRKDLVLEFFYRERRRALDVWVDEDGKPRHGKWNFDEENRKAFKQAPEVNRPYRPCPDAVTKEVMELVERTWPGAPGRMESFDWPVTRREAQRALRDFIDARLAKFGTYEDAMWAGETVLYHSRLASSLNLKLLHPRECIDAALDAYEEGRAAENAVEGFVRQIIGWREFVRGVYYREGADYLRRNGLGHHGSLPEFYWTAETEMHCVRDCVGAVLDEAWGHHIPRLMVLGNFALIAGVHPSAINDWFLGMYVDAVDWVTAPNVIGMSQHADHGVIGTKPYAGSAAYINRMSNYCKDCRFDPRQRTGGDACPFNTFYWDFLIRHRDRFADNRRMGLALRNVDRLDDDEQTEIRTQARRLRSDLGIRAVSR